MDHQNISFSATQKTNTFSIVGDGFWYIDATAADGVDTSIKITTKGGGTIPLKPGQHFRLADQCDSWTIASMTGAEVFTGNIIIGNGDFGDSNISNKVVLDASFANNVTVMNTGANPVPVSGSVNTVQGAMTYTHSFASEGDTQNASPLTVLAPAENVNGVTVKKFEYTGKLANEGLVALIAHTAAPTTMTDGAVLEAVSFAANTATSAGGDVNIFVPAGKGLYIRSTGSTANALKSVLYTVH